MSKKIDLTQKVMSRIKTGQVRMRPRWYFLLGSAGLLFGLTALIIVSVFLVSLISFSLRTHGPMGQVKFAQLLSGFPWWAAVLAALGLLVGTLLLKRYDFSYKRNFLLIAVIFAGSVILAGLAVNYLGLDSLWASGRLMRGIYRQYDGGYRFGPRGRMGPPSRPMMGR